jgi:hypothetical protein
MNKTVVAFYDDFFSANHAVKDLIDNGFARDAISLIASDAAGQDAYRYDLEKTIEPNDTGVGVRAGAGIGATVGGVSGLLVGLGSLFIPGIGPVIAAGPVTAVLSTLTSAGIGAAVGGITGGLLGALMDVGIPEESAHHYAEGVRRGGSLVTLKTTDQRAEQAAKILNRYDPINIKERADEWREEGRRDFDPLNEADEFEEEIHWPYPSQPREERSLDVPDYYAPEDFDYYEPDFRDHFSATEMYRNDYAYEQFQPAYRYGYSLATDEHNWDREWDDIEPEARRYWEKYHPGPWERFKDAVRYAWEAIKEAVR